MLSSATKWYFSIQLQLNSWSYFTESKGVKIMRFECQNPKLWQFEDLKLLSSAIWWSNFKTNTLVEISKKISTWTLNFIVFKEQKNFNPKPTQFLTKIFDKLLVTNDAPFDAWYFGTLFSWTFLKPLWVICFSVLKLLSCATTWQILKKFSIQFKIF